MSNRLFHFSAGDTGPWQITDMRAIQGECLAAASHLAVEAGPAADHGAQRAWSLRGMTSNERYTGRPHTTALLKVQPPLGRAESTRGALIPIRKTAAWWALTQDERLELFVEKSRHTEIGLRYLPAIARRLHHCRDLGEAEPFDFLTWFEFAPADEARFDDLLAALRASAHWAYVDREVDIRLTRSI